MRTILATALLSGAVGCGWLGPARSKPALSVLLIVVDSLRADHLGAYGYLRATSPRIDALAGGGVLFTNAFSQAPWTKPSVASLFTSTYMSVHSVVYSKQEINGEERTDVLNPKFLTLPEALKTGGFATAGFGMKIHLQPRFGFDQGFDAYDMHARRADKINRRTLDWLRQKDPDKFFIYLHYNDPHYPYLPRPGYARFGATTARVQIDGVTKKAFREGRLTLSREDVSQLVDLYDGEVLYTDEQIGRLLDAVAKMGYENVLTILTADHGEEFLDHGSITHGQSLYNELVHVPLIMGGSAFSREGSSMRKGRIADTVQLIDVMPTLLAMAGLPEPPGMQGRSLTSYLSGPAEPAGQPVAMFSERRAPTDTGFWHTIFDGRWKLIHDPTAGRTMLFDIAADPGETVSLEESNPDVAAGLTRLLAAWAEANRKLHDSIRPEDTAPLDPETEQRLRSLGYVD